MKKILIPLLLLTFMGCATIPNEPVSGSEHTIIIVPFQTRREIWVEDNAIERNRDYYLYQRDRVRDRGERYNVRKERRDDLRNDPDAIRKSLRRNTEKYLEKHR